MPDGEAGIQERCRGAAKMPVQRKEQEQDREAICKYERKELVIQENKRLSRDFKLFLAGKRWE